MRDRLIELICDGTLKTEICTTATHLECESCRGDCGYCAILADHLLKNNVISLSCKVSDKVYENYRGHIFEYVITSIEISSPYDILYKVRATESWNRCVRFIGFDKQDIGKTIFLTRKEAERALKGGDE